MSLFSDFMSLMWRKYYNYLRGFPPWVLSRKQTKLFSPLNFPVEGVIFYWNSEGSCQQRRVIFLCRGKPRVTTTAWNSQAPALGRNLSRLLAITHCSAPSSCLSPLPHHKRVGAPSGRFTASLCPCVFHPHFLPRTSPPYGWCFFPETKGNQILKLKFSG